MDVVTETIITFFWFSLLSCYFIIKEESIVGSFFLVWYDEIFIACIDENLHSNVKLHTALSDLMQINQLCMTESDPIRTVVLLGEQLWYWFWMMLLQHEFGLKLSFKCGKFYLVTFIWKVCYMKILNRQSYNCSLWSESNFGFGWK